MSTRVWLAGFEGGLLSSPALPRAGVQACIQLARTDGILRVERPALRYPSICTLRVPRGVIRRRAGGPSRSRRLDQVSAFTISDLASSLLATAETSLSFCPTLPPKSLPLASENVWGERSSCSTLTAMPSLSAFSAFPSCSVCCGIGTKRDGFSFKTNWAMLVWPALETTRSAISRIESFEGHHS